MVSAVLLAVMRVSPGLTILAPPKLTTETLVKRGRSSFRIFLLLASAALFLPGDPAVQAQSWTDSSGNHRWSKAISSDRGRIQTQAIAIDRENNVILLGQPGGTTDFGRGSLAVEGADALFVAKYDNDGNCIMSELFNSSGNPLLAQGGSGDVLAGYLGGLLAQPQLQADPTTTLRYGVWQHGAAADALSGERTNWTVEDLLVALGNRKK